MSIYAIVIIYYCLLTACYILLLCRYQYLMYKYPIVVDAYISGYEKTGSITPGVRTEHITELDVTFEMNGTKHIRHITKGLQDLIIDTQHPLSIRVSASNPYNVILGINKPDDMLLILAALCPMLLLFGAFAVNIYTNICEISILLK